MKEIQRVVVSAILFSKDGKILMGRKDPLKGGIYPDCWHIPGGGVEENESLLQALIREVMEEVKIDISPYKIVSIPFVEHLETEKTLKENNERVLCKMEINRFEVHIDDKNADEIEIISQDDLIDLCWFSKEELMDVKQIPGGKEFFKKMGYI